MPTQMLKCVVTLPLRCIAPVLSQLLQLFQRSLLRVIGFVFERYDSNVNLFMKVWCFTLAGMRHVLGSLLEALGQMHRNGLAHADLKPCNILLRVRHLFRDGWRRLSVSESSEEVAPSVAASAVFGAAVGASE